MGPANRHGIIIIIDVTVINSLNSEQMKREDRRQLLSFPCASVSVLRKKDTRYT